MYEGLVFAGMSVKLDACEMGVMVEMGVVDIVRATPSTGLPSPWTWCEQIEGFKLGGKAGANNRAEKTFCLHAQ